MRVIRACACGLAMTPVATATAAMLIHLRIDHSLGAGTAAYEIRRMLNRDRPNMAQSGRRGRLDFRSLSQQRHSHSTLLWRGPEGAQNERAFMSRSTAMSMSAFPRGWFATAVVVWMVLEGGHAQTPD